MKKQVLFMLTALFAFASCSDDVNVEPLKERVDIPLTTEEDNMVDDVYYKFGMKVFRSLMDQSADENIIFSPTSLFLATSIAANGADSDTRREILNVLGCSDKDVDEINSLNKKVIENFRTLDNSTNISVASSVWYSDMDGEPKSTIKDVLREYYEAPLTGVDDLSSADAVKLINDWCNLNTHGEIPSLIPSITPSDSHDSGSLILANALYFKGQWKDKFDAKLTTDKEFYSESKGVKSVPTMKNPKISVIGYGTDSYTAVSLPYGNKAFSMLIILPDEGHDLKECFVEEEYEKLRSLAKEKLSIFLNYNGAQKALNLEMPKFVLNTNIDLTNTLKSLGINKVFDKDQADFSNFFETANLVLGSMKQISKIMVDETGTTAASVTHGKGDMASNFQEIEDFIVNRPFAIMIVEKSTGIPLFIGKISNL